MRISAVIMTVLAVSVVIPAGASARTPRAVRRIELLSMQSTLPADSTDVSTTSPSPMADASPLPDSFRVHDLSRRYVEYRMARELAAGAQPESDAVSGAPMTVALPVAATSAIAVPGWMRSGFAAVAAVPYMPGCTPLAYRPAGFLGRDAEARRASYYAMMSAIACEQGIPIGLFDAMIIRESGYNPMAISSARAFGFAQLMPGTAAYLGVNRYDPTQNMRGGARYLRQQLDKFGQVHLALAAYNAGPGRVRNGMVPRIRETQAYVSNILANWTRLGSLSVTQGNPLQQAVRPARQVQLAAF